MHACRIHEGSHGSVQQKSMRATYRIIRRRARAAQRFLFQRVSRKQLDAALDSVLPNMVDVLFVHSSLSHCGYLEPGPEGVLSSLRQRCQTLCLPTHTYCYTVDGHTEVFDPRTTPSRSGAITNAFRGLPDTLRSVHSTHSLAALGPRAAELCQGHLECQTACGVGTPYEKLVHWDASVLMFGVSLNTYTLFHYSEHQAGCSYLYESDPYQLLAKDYDGKLHSVEVWRQDMQVPRRFAEMRHELADAELIQSQPLGHGELLFIPSSSAVHAFTSEKLGLDEFHLVDRTRWSPPS